jgi:threonine dehydratase
MHPDRNEITTAAALIAEFVRETPVLSVPGISLGRKADVHLKLEQLQHSGSFKARGAMHALLRSEVPAAGVVAASGGNHGAAVAWAAAQLGHRANIFVPDVASSAKVDRLRAYGAVVHTVGSVYSEALTAAEDFRETSGAISIHAYDQREVVAGAGTVAREFEHQVSLLGGEMDVVMVACGGGGLSGGMASWFANKTPIVVIETEGTATFAAAKASKGPTSVEVSGLVADSLGATRLGDIGWSALSSSGAESIVVTDQAVTKARRLLWDQFRLLVEPAAAAPIAALGTSLPVLDQARSIGIVICGANTTTSL